MELVATPAQLDIADATAEYLSKEVPLPRIREMSAAGRDTVVDDDTWRRWAAQGFFSLGVAETTGGLGLGIVEEFLVVEQFGRHLTPGPVVPTMLATHVASAAGLDDLTGALLAGTARVGLRVGNTGYDVSAGGLVLSVTRGGAELHTVAEAADVPGIDPSTRLSRIMLGECVASIDDELLQLRLWVLQSALLLGVAEAAQEQSTDYVKVRQQFGQAVGAFQAVKHRCADMVTRCYVASAQLHLAALFVEGGRPDARFQTASALTLTLDAAATNSAVNIQNHGGIGFTAEHDAGLILKRAVALAAAAGPETDRLDAMIRPTRTLFG
jgi:alkylation response protein AidB-like acyl-CoA dehydrogenase